MLNSAFRFKTSRSGGKGGQNVNKVSTKVLLEFDIEAATMLTAEQKEVLKNKLAKKLTTDGILQVTVQTDRTQLANKNEAVRKLYKMLNTCFVVAKKRKATKPTQAAVNKRLTNKKNRSTIKKQRKLTVNEW
ncbi:MAG: aminoacyl-tRNA hydrolase [Bacteroidia bacterium]|nr:aminoacyl-tRNA hydrolase [Bacteroidia bacterium]